MKRLIVIFVLLLFGWAGCRQAPPRSQVFFAPPVYPRPASRLFDYRDGDFRGVMTYLKFPPAFLLKLEEKNRPDVTLVYPAAFRFYPQITPYLSYNPKHRRYYYSYRVFNRPVAGGQSIGKMMFLNLAEINQPSAVEGWRFNYAIPRRPYSGWFVKNPQAPGIASGETRNFSFASPAPPGVVEFQLWGQARYPDLPVSSPKITAGVDEVIYSLARLNGVRVYLPAPVPLPRISVGGFPLYLVSQLRRARKSGWLTADTFKGWERALTELGRIPERAPAFASRLKDLKLKVYAQYPQELTPPAYFLLMGNLEFLSAHLGEPFLSAPYRPSDEAVCRAAMEEARTAVGFYLHETGKWPQKYQDLADLLPAFGPMPGCPAGEEIFGYTHSENPPGFTVYCRNRHQDLPPGYPQYRYRGVPPNPYPAGGEDSRR